VTDRRQVPDRPYRKPSGVVARRQGTVLRAAWTARAAQRRERDDATHVCVRESGAGATGPLRFGFNVPERQYDITPDGKRFIGAVDAGLNEATAPDAPQIQVVLHWFEELKARVSTK
jgi:hypothetical protein